ncbi:MAG: tetratricopeptide repeat protein [Acidobacteria bacterium]|nr:tetratricopeptide repeat protein [Acidobacteriota bacterium]
MLRFHLPCAAALIQLILAGSGLQPALAQQPAEKQSSGPPPQSEGVPRTLTPQDYPAWNISNDAQTLITEALKGGDYQYVENTLAKLIEQNPNSPQLLTFLARVFFLDNKPLNCAIALKKAEKLGPLKESEQFTLALCYVILKRLDWAADEFERLAHSYPGNALYPYWQGRIAYDNYAYAEAVARFNKALRLDPEMVRAYDNLGLCYEGMSDNQRAVENYERAVTLNRSKSPSSPWPPLNYGMLLLKQGSLEQAEPLLQEAARLGPGLAQARCQLGVLLAKQERHADAIAELQKAAELDPSYPQPHLTLAHVYRRLGEKGKAEAELAAFQKLKQAQEDQDKQTGATPPGEKRPK